MIVCSLEKLAVGEIVTGSYVHDKDGNPHMIPFLVLREATKEEFIAYAEMTKADINYKIFPNFYEIHID